MIVVLLSGYARSGKDTVASLLVQRYGFVRFAYADAMKDEAARLYGLSRASLDTQGGKKMYFNERTVRDILIEHGTKRRAEDPGYWVKIILREIEQSHVDRVVLSDWRYLNEYTLLKSHFPSASLIRWRVDRFDTSSVDDASEKQLEKSAFDLVIPNRSTLGDLYDVVNLATKTLPLPWFVCDVDDTLLQWMPCFVDFVRNSGYQTATEWPNDWNGTNFIVRGPSTEIDFLRLVKCFNESQIFGDLEAVDGSVEAIKRAVRAGFVLIALSSCGDARDVVRRRKENLVRVFGDVFAAVECLPLGSSKVPFLSAFSYPGLFLDDRPVNVAAAAEKDWKAFILSRPWNLNATDPSDNKVDGWHDPVFFLQTS